MSREDRLLLAFAGVLPSRRRSLEERYEGRRGVLEAIRRGAVPGLAVPDDVDAAAAVLESARCRLVLRGDDGYPGELEGIEEPPDALFIRGSAIRPVPRVAVVGTRGCTEYGRRLARSFGRVVAEAGWCLVSGLARGIDGAAHRGTADAAGPGIGVLGSGIDIVYPRQNADLYDYLAEHGSLVSEYPPGTAPQGWRFPPRNRLISGLSAAVVVVEAGDRGGALITAARAVEQGKEVFAVPGDVDRESSVGCNLLIRDGAVPVMGPGDLVEALSLVMGAPPRARSAPQLPVGGSVDEFSELVGLSGPPLLSLLSRMELAGEISTDGIRVYPPEDSPL